MAIIFSDCHVQIRNMKCEVVIGANYGDEGKGQTTYDVCRRHEKPIVVMTNGGCQRGHTVDVGGFRYIFHHFGSGTPLGCPTYFPATYFMNPMQYVKEYHELEGHGMRPVAYRSEKCVMQFPSDAIVNQILEKARQNTNSEHGSCGCGIWETVVRNKCHPVTVEEFANLNRKQKKCLYNEILNEQINVRLNNDVRSCDLLEIIQQDSFIEHFLDDFDFMHKSSSVLGMSDLLKTNNYDWVVFENAQGLLLDEEYSHDITHSTPSKTGLGGVSLAIRSSTPGTFDPRKHIYYLYVNYVSRTYLTRHGAGTFEEYDSKIKFEDKTNIPNAWQGTLRFGHFNDVSCEKLKMRTNDDFHKYANDICINSFKKLVFTHQDQYISRKLIDFGLLEV